MTSPQVRLSSAKRARILILPALAAILALAWWAWSSNGAPELPAISQPDRDSVVSTVARDSSTLAPSPPSNSDLSQSRERASSQREVQSAPDPGLFSSKKLSTGSKTVTLVANFVGPDRQVLTLDTGTLIVRSASGARREVPIGSVSSVQVEGLARGNYFVDVVAPSFDHREQQVDLSTPEQSGARAGPHGELLLSERIFLWPAEWIAVVCKTPAGKRFSELAASFDTEPKRLFVDAFEVRTRIDRPTGDAWETGASQPATFSKPKGYQNWDLPGGVIGSLQLVQPPPMWVGLRLYGKVVGWELLAPGAREVVFRLDESMFEERFASLTLQVVDAASGQGVADASVTLLADTSALRRSEHQKVATDAEGKVKLARIVPARYELTITRGESSTHQQFVELAASERRDLGKIALAIGQPFEIRVVDEQGQPVSAWLEMGTYGSGARIQDVYPPMLSHKTDDKGATHLPTPSRASVVRATQCLPPDYRPTEVRSPNVLVDPQRLSASPLVLVVHRPVRTTLEVSDAHVGSVEFRDSLGLVVGAAQSHSDSAGPPQADAWPETNLIPGSYRATFIGKDGSVLDERPFEVTGENVRLMFP